MDSFSEIYRRHHLVVLPRSGLTLPRPILLLAILPFIASGNSITSGLQEFDCFLSACRSIYCSELQHASEKSPQSARRRISSTRILRVHSFPHLAIKSGVSLLPIAYFCQFPSSSFKFSSSKSISQFSFFRQFGARHLFAPITENLQHVNLQSTNFTCSGFS